jgi:uncharacterized protein (AIM24 family)
MPVPSTISDLSTSAILNSPAGTDPISNTLDDYLRSIQGILKSQFAQGTAITVSGSTITIPETGSAFLVSASTTQTVTGLSSNFSGRVVALQFQDGNITLTNSASLILPNATSYTSAANDVLVFVSKGSGIWQCVSGKPLAGTIPVLTYAGTTTSVRVY